MLAILNTTLALLALITQLGVSPAFLRAYNYDYASQRDRNDVLSTSLILLVAVSLPGFIAIALLAPSLSVILLHTPTLSKLVVITGYILLVQNLTIPGLTWLRAESRALFFCIVSISNLLVTLVATLVLVGVFHLGIAGALIAVGCGYASMVAGTIPMILLRTRPRLRADIARNLLSFGLPHVPGFISFWFLQLSDRYLLSLFGSLGQVASYSVSYTLGWALSTVLVGPFGLAWPTTMYAIARRSDAANVFRLVFRVFSLALLFAAFGLSLIGSLIIKTLFPPSYDAGAIIVPIIAASSVLYGIYYIFMVGADLRRKAWLVAVFFTVAAVINVSVNLVVIPRYGSLGAALSTLLAYIALASMAYLGNQRIYPLPFEVGRFLFAGAIGIALYLGSAEAGHLLGGSWSLFIGFLALLLYGVVLIRLAVTGHSLRRYMRVIWDWRF